MKNNYFSNVVSKKKYPLLWKIINYLLKTISNGVWKYFKNILLNLHNVCFYDQDSSTLRICDQYSFALGFLYDFAYGYFQIHSYLFCYHILLKIKIQFLTITITVILTKHVKH